MAFLNSYTVRAARLKHEILSHAQFPSLMATLNDLKTFCSRQSLVLKILLFPTKSEVYKWVIDGGIPWETDETPSGFSKVLAAYCTSNGIDYIDLKPFFIEAAHEVFVSSQQAIWWSDDTHINNMGHKIAAELVYRNLMNASASS